MDIYGGSLPGNGAIRFFISFSLIFTEICYIREAERLVVTGKKLLRKGVNPPEKTTAGFFHTERRQRCIGTCFQRSVSVTGR